MPDTRDSWLDDLVQFAGLRLDWRWELSQVLGTVRRRRHRVKDAVVLRLMDFHRWRSRLPAQRAARRLGRQFGDVIQALEVHTQDGEPRRLIEALALADTPLTDIAATTRLPAAVVETYEAAFYDVRARLTYCAFVPGVVLPSARASHPTDVRDGLWKHLTHLGGAGALQAFRDRGTPLSPEHADLLTKLTVGLITSDGYCTLLAAPPEPVNRHARRRYLRLQRRAVAPRQPRPTPQ